MKIIFSTVDSSSEAERIAETLVNESLAACVNIVPGLRSIYRWKGAVHDESELLLIIKTSSEKSEEALARLVDIHPYELPEAVVIEVHGAHPPYLEWISAETRGLG